MPTDGYLVVSFGASNNAYLTLLSVSVRVRGKSELINDVISNSPYAYIVSTSPRIKKNTIIDVSALLFAQSWPSDGSGKILIDVI